MSLDPPPPAARARRPGATPACTRRALLRGSVAALVPVLLAPVLLGATGLAGLAGSAGTGLGPAGMPAPMSATPGPTLLEPAPLGPAPLASTSNGSPDLLGPFRAWADLHARINDEVTPPRVARRLARAHAKARDAVAALPATSLAGLAAKVLALTEHGTCELPEALVEECTAIVTAAEAEAAAVEADAMT